MTILTKKIVAILLLVGSILSVFSCSVQECEHEWADGKCGLCNEVCEHEWTDLGKCNICKLDCKHEWADGACELCGSVCIHDWEKHADAASVCKTCDATCTHEIENGECKACAVTCEHSYSSYEYLEKVLVPYLCALTAPAEKALSTSVASKSFYNSTWYFTNYLEYYKFQDKYSEFYGMDELFIFAATVMQAESVSSVYKERTEFVAEGHKDEFNARFRNFAELFDITEDVYICADHGCEVEDVFFSKNGDFEEAWCEECDDFVYHEDIVIENALTKVYYCFEHSYRAADADEECPECSCVIENPTTVAELLFIDKNGELNRTAVWRFVSLVNNCAKERTGYSYTTNYNLWRSMAEMFTIPECICRFCGIIDIERYLVTVQIKGVSDEILYFTNGRITTTVARVIDEVRLNYGTQYEYYVDGQKVDEDYVIEKYCTLEIREISAS